MSVQFFSTYFLSPIVWPLYFVLAVEPVVARPENPCSPDPCGPFATCRPDSGRPACSCQPGYFGAPPNCRPECLLSSDCGLSQACVRQKCVDPCPGTCGTNAECKVVNHNPICSCPARFTGDPFINCVREPEVWRLGVDCWYFAPYLLCLCTFFSVKVWC